MKALPDDMHVLTGSYVLDALGETERADFERHLQRCPSCESEVRGLRETAARLAMAKSVRPPAQMEERVLAATYRARQLPPVGSDRFRLAHRRIVPKGLFSLSPGRQLSGRRAGGRVRPQAHPLDHPRDHPRDNRRLRSPRLIGAFAAASVAVAIGLGITQLSTQHQLDSAQYSAAAIARVVQAPDAHLETMRTSAGGTATVVYSSKLGGAIISTTGLADLPSGRVYQAWVMNSAGARSAGLISHPNLSSQLLASGVRSGDRIGITVEPAGGTSHPTTQAVLVMPLTT
ncbi:MAG: anti-sigma factor [Actinomycetota bacterium]|nr:anti-sigma factor [Actinomycetota bacterium]